MHTATSNRISLLNPNIHTDPKNDPRGEANTNEESKRPEPVSTLRKGDEIVLTADTAAFNGVCVGRHEGMAIFLSGCIPGDNVRATVRKKKKAYAEARVQEILSPGPDRVDPPCVYFGDCGGCKWQNLAYEAQLYWKRQHVLDSFQRIGGFENVEIRETIGCEVPYWYRNKMEFSFGASRWLTEKEIATGEDFRKDFALGLHAPGRFDKVLDVRECLLQSPFSNRILNATRDFALERDLPPYSTLGHTGLLRNLVVRTSRATGEIMVALITSDDSAAVANEYVPFLLARVPEVTTIIHGINRKKAQIAFSEEVHVLHGSGTITERIAGNDFTISPFSFFQTNSGQAERLYEEALNAAQLTGDQTAWDLYCGTGTITLAAAARAGLALGVELNEGAVADARINAERNGVENAVFIAGDLKDVIRDLEAGNENIHRPDVVIVDPPRAGMHEDVVRALLRLAPERISYVSCNPTTQARDCALLAERYRVEYVQPVDMFPQTYHIETVARLVRTDS